MQRHSSHRDCRQELGHRERAPGILRRERDTPSHKDTARQAEGNEHPFCSDTLPHSNSVSLFTCHRAGWPGQHNSKHLSRTQGSEKATAGAGWSMPSSMPTTGTKSPCPFCHLGVALSPRWAKVSNLPYALCFSKLTCCRSTKALVLLSLEAEEEKVLSSPKPCMGTQSLSRWETPRKTRHKEVQGLGVPHTASPTSWPSFLPI